LNDVLKGTDLLEICIT